ncbi:hypothetical protein G6F57_004752 [Rhizopus arrhizus]|uniref:Uncharacterized protein n=1 Tax=Rhizopus oryzae TaxID=64495 RepID=A0A9P6XCL2_RHIOR|nr:hypothetical protein G6F23_003035 [Rhizopus arrhizus]KAG1408078.1 hypothetical protein G6F58_009540 [Rhizopus delemar]KAG0765889.1 hypothetical protein G6F24_004059 [Rhizopus arrhizus]KAG0786160.1 hypothetical protein G6F22_007713 [Rhizopus arrhizus]KAG0792145.1 hypothetical protein G6F21_004561 [Rhizopus arrhizus]
MVNDLERKYNDGQSEEGSSMTRIMEEKKKKKFTMKQWLSPVIWDEEDDEDDEDDEDTNDDDKDNNH